MNEFFSLLRYLVRRQPFIFFILSFAFICLLIPITPVLWEVIQNHKGVTIMDTQTIATRVPEILLIAMTVVGTFFVLIRYLRIGEDKSERLFDFEMQMRLKDLEQELSRKEAGISNQEKEVIKKTLLEQIASDGSAQLIEQFKKDLAENYPQITFANNIEMRCQETIARLSNELRALSRRSNLNLVIGIMTALAGLGVLAYVVFTTDKIIGNTTVSTILSSYIPRLSLVIFIEVFAYFFLKLYKSNLGEIKYFQNELTNVEAKVLALHIALAANDKELKTKVINELCDTERNFILKKGETTREIEQARLEKNTMVEMSGAISDIIQKIKK